MFTNWFRVLFPMALLGLVFGFYPQMLPLIEANLAVTTNLPYVLLSIAMVVSYAFKQSRSAMVSAAALMTYWVIQQRLQVPLSYGNTTLELSLLCVLLPLCLFACLLFSDSGRFVRSFLTYLVILISCGLLFYLVVTSVPLEATQDLQFSWLMNLDSFSRLPFVLVIYMVGMTGLALVMLVRHNRNIDAMIYTVMLLCCATFALFHLAYISSSLFTLVGILLLFFIGCSSYQLAFNDGLTGIPGRHTLDLDILQLGSHFTIAMVDIDHFKMFNDQYGHDTGDDVLKLVAKQIAKTKGNPRFYRYGGEEFTILYHRRRANQAIHFLEQLRQDIANYPMSLRDTSLRPESNTEGSRFRSQKESNAETVHVTVSIGVADSTLSLDPIDVLKAADSALYAAKRGGRNRIINASAQR
ncbi:GGDEF domain-containing protein [Vibrio sp. WXL103]|uniref:GGDEF domain-containing protein n=1 Tax=Vibrio sp. WXL103 TaxID=3450710 RepID=UPI003EC6CD6B